MYARLLKDLNKELKGGRSDNNRSQRSLSLHTIDVQPALNFKQKFQKHVFKSIEIIEELQINKMPQKCFPHNLNFTLYCKQDKKPLCPHCINKYNNPHKNHKICPLSSSLDEMQDDIKVFESVINTIRVDMQKDIHGINQKIGNIDQQSQQIENTIRKHYKKIEQMCKQQEHQLITELEYQTRKLKCERAVISGNLKKSLVYIESVLQKYNKQEYPMLVKRNVFQILSKTEKYLREDINKQSYMKNLTFDSKLLQKNQKDILQSHQKMMEQLQIIGKHQVTHSITHKPKQYKQTKKLTPLKTKQKQASPGLSPTKHNKSVGHLTIWK